MVRALQVRQPMRLVSLHWWASFAGHVRLFLRKSSSRTVDRLPGSTGAIATSFLLRNILVGWVDGHRRAALVGEPHQTRRNTDGGARCARPTLQILDLPQQKLLRGKRIIQFVLSGFQLCFKSRFGVVTLGHDLENFVDHETGCFRAWGRHLAACLL